MDFKYFKQETDYSCGPACIRMFLYSIGKKISEKQLIKELKTTKKNGTTNANILNFIKVKGFSYIMGNDSTIFSLKKLIKNNCVIVLYYLPNFKEHHYAIVKSINKNNTGLIDPWYGENYLIKTIDFEKQWSKKSKQDNEKKWFIAIKNKTKN